MKVCVVGSTMIDLVTRVERLPKMGETFAGSSFALGYGGKGGNQAVMAARLGADVTIVTRIGSDTFGDGALENYRANGLDVRHVVRDAAHASGVAPIFVDEAGRNCVIIVRGANDALGPDDVRDAADVIADADVLVCQLEVPLPAVSAALTAARNAGTKTILNPAPATPVPDEIWRLVDVAVPNESEIEILTGISVARDDDAERAAEALLERGAGAVILTLGERGALVMNSDTREWIAPLRVTARDSTGAGDAFVGTLAVSLAGGATLGEAARHANVVAALSVTQPGTQTSFPTRDAVERFRVEAELAHAR